MKKLYEGQRNSLYYLQKRLNLDIKRLYRYADGKIDVGKMPVEVLCGIANVEGIDPVVLYRAIKEYQEKKALNK